MSLSLPSRGAWIEMIFTDPGDVVIDPSLPSRGAWIEITGALEESCIQRSLPSRGAWIEMRKVDIDPNQYMVAPLTGSVD